MTEQTGKRLTVIILLPKYYNPDERGQRKKVEGRKFKTTCEEIEQMMQERWHEGGGTLVPGRSIPRLADVIPSLKGWWRRAGVTQWDDLVAIVIANFPDTSEDKEWLKEYAHDVLRNRFRQEAVSVFFVPRIELHTV